MISLKRKECSENKKKQGIGINLLIVLLGAICIIIIGFIYTEKVLGIKWPDTLIECKICDCIICA